MITGATQGNVNEYFAAWYPDPTISDLFVVGRRSTSDNTYLPWIASTSVDIEWSLAGCSVGAARLDLQIQSQQQKYYTKCIVYD